MKDDSRAFRLCEVAAALAEEYGEFTQEQVCVHAWKQWPEKFGLRGFESIYPDLVCIRNVLYGRKGLLARGYLIKYPDGKLRVGQLPVNGQAPAEESEDKPLSAGAARDLERMTSTRAWGLWECGQKDQIAFGDVVAFLGDQEHAAKLFADRRTAQLRRAGACYDWMVERFETRLEHYRKTVANRKGRAG